MRKNIGLRLSMLVALSMLIITNSCREILEWRENGFVSAFLNFVGTEFIIRYKKEGQPWVQVNGIPVTSSGDVLGVSLGTRHHSLNTLIGYTIGDKLSVHTGVGLIFDQNPDDILSGVGTSPDIIHIEDDSWLIAYTPSNGTSFEIRKYEYGPTGGFDNLVDLSAVSNNDYVMGRPAMAYYAGKLVIVWAKKYSNNDYRFRYAVGDYDFRSGTLNIITQGNIPPLTSNSGAEFKSTPSLTVDNDGNFYLANVYRSNFTNLSRDWVEVYNSSNGSSWNLIIPGIPNNEFNTGSTFVNMAAQTDGQLMLGIISGYNVPGKTYYYDANASWNDLGSQSFGFIPRSDCDFSLSRWEYLESIELPDPEPAEPTLDQYNIIYQTNRDGNWEVYGTNGDGSNTINLSNSTGFDLIANVNAQGNMRMHPWDQLWDLNGSQFCYMSDRDGPSWDLFLANMNGQPINLSMDPSNDQQIPAVSPPIGASVIFTTDGPILQAGIYIINNLPPAIQLTDVDSDSDPFWSPNGTVIAFESYREGNWEIYTMNSDGTNITNLTQNLGDDFHPHWSPDGTQILFQSTRTGNSEIYVMNADGSNQNNLTNNPGANDFSPKWAPNGGAIIFVSDRDATTPNFNGWSGNDEVYIMAIDGSNQRNLSNSSGDDFDPNWSRDGRWIAFSSNRDGNWEIYIMRANGANQTNISNNLGDDFHPVWRPVLNN